MVLGTPRIATTFRRCVVPLICVRFVRRARLERDRAAVSDSTPMAYSNEVATLRAEVQLRTRRFAEIVVAPLARTGVTPNALTIVGLVLNIVAGLVLASGEWTIGGALVLIAGAFDMFDGALARVMNQKTDFGAFLDSTLDRYSEVVVLVGLQIGFLHDDGVADFRLIGIALGAFILANSLMISYARARAEGLRLDCEVGWFQRPERVAFTGIATMLPTYVMMAGLVVLALGTLWTVGQRIRHVWQLTERERR
jgi:CDP-diacylglycerol--glycerol-3-phosphate 3-phosphatidyltransferase